MEASQAFHRCMQQLLIQHPRCLKLSTNNPTARLVPRQKRKAAFSSQTARSFTITTSRFQSNESTAQSRPEDQNNARVGSQTSGQTPLNKSTLNETRNRQPHNQAGQNGPRDGRVLSSATVRDQSSPQTSQEARERASAQLDRLLGLRPRRQPSEDPSNQQEQDRPKPVYNNDLFGPRSNILQNRGNAGPRSSPAPDIGAMLEDLTLRTDGPPKQAEINLRLKPTLGKQVDVENNRGMDVTRAFQILERKINTNGNAVKHEARLQKNHIRAGQQRKIDKRLRWRVLFREGFLAETAKIRKMIKQGW